MSNNWWETDLNLEIWQAGGKCPTCSGVLKYRYTRTDKPGIELQIFPIRKKFRLLNGHSLIMEEPLEKMKEKLDGVDS